MPVTSGPRRQDTSSGTADVLAPCEAAVEAQTRVLIADDHPVVREGLRVLLENSGMTVIGEAVNGRQAIELALETAPDIVLMDIRMPVIDGLTATQMIKREMPGVAVIMLTSYEDKEYFLRSLEAGASSFVLKGIPGDALMETIRAVRSGSAVIDRQMVDSLASGTGGTPAGRRPDITPLDALAPHERRVLRLLTRGLSNNAIAEETGYTLGTVKNIVHRIITKLGVTDRTQAAIIAAHAWPDPD